MKTGRSPYVLCLAGNTLLLQPKYGIKGIQKDKAAPSSGKNLQGLIVGTRAEAWW